MSAQPYTSLSVLVVDDNQHMRAILVSLLRAFGVQNITEAEDGADGLLNLQTREFDLVLCDLAMSPIDGVEFLQMLRRSADSRNPQVPVIVVTGNAQRKKVEEARDAGADEFVAKPVSTEALFRRIKSALERPRPFVRANTFFGPDRRRRAAEPAPAARRESDQKTFI